MMHVPMDYCFRHYHIHVNSPTSPVRQLTRKENLFLPVHLHLSGHLIPSVIVFDPVNESTLSHRNKCITTSNCETFNSFFLPRDIMK